MRYPRIGHPSRPAGRVRPSAPARPDPRRITTGDIISALRGLPRPRDITKDAIDRIEEKIFAAAFNERLLLEDERVIAGGFGELELPELVAEGPVPSEYFAGVDRRTLEAVSPVHAASALDDVHLVGEVVPLRPVSAERNGSSARPVRASRLRRYYRGATRALASVAAAAVLTGATAAAAEKADVGDFLYPVKLQVEAVRLALAPSALGKAEVSLSIASDRLGALRRMNAAAPAEFAIVTGEMDGAGLRALALLTRAHPQPRRTVLLGALYELARSEQIVLERLMWAAPPEAAASIVRSFEVAGRIARATRTLLAPASAVPPALEWPLPQDSTLAEGGTIPRRLVATKATPEHRPADPQPPPPQPEPEPEPEDDRECSGLGLTCVVGLPIPDLPGG